MILIELYDIEEIKIKIVYVRKCTELLISFRVNIVQSQAILEDSVYSIYC